MASKYPFVKNTDTSLRNLWNRRVYEYLDEFFRKAYFDNNSTPVVSDDPGAERSIDSYKRAGSDDGWALPCGGGSEKPYKSYFRVLIDANGMIAVTNGADSATEESKCGAVKVNGQRVDVLADFFAPGTSTTHYIWLHSWIDSDGVAHAKIIDGDTIPPDNPNDGIGHGSQLLARVAVDEDGVATITQDYLRGGEHLEIIAGDCNGGAIAEAE